ncbi:hypothetical protein [Bacillus sp. CGMCC 1.16541]|uniref:hypothetical protein n=1 Tax=Bacillus sp. CGMCC 1.16541 TaxID=2185143 RepID=UPI00194FEE8B|nr:hypothetical protein [Bacillus sp. CGMCC 1.16541]
MKVIIPTRKLTYTKDELNSWIEGNREYCFDQYCRSLPGSKEFGEYIAGKYC